MTPERRAAIEAECDASDDSNHKSSHQYRLNCMCRELLAALDAMQRERDRLRDFVEVRADELLHVAATIKERDELRAALAAAAPLVEGK